jgi:hypothetical protein
MPPQHYLSSYLKQEKGSDTQTSSKLGDEFLENATKEVLDGWLKGSRDKFDNILPHERRLSQEELGRLAKKFDYACNGGLTGIGTDVDTVMDVLSTVPQSQMKDFDKHFRNLHGGKSWGVENELKDELSGKDLVNAMYIFKPKNINDILLRPELKPDNHLPPLEIFDPGEKANKAKVNKK